jgi:hypothetical protein
MVKLFSQSLSSRFLIFSFLSILLPIFLVNVFSYHTTREALIKTVIADNTSLVLSTTNEIRNDILALKDTFKTAGFTLSVADNLEEKKDILVVLVEGSSMLNSLVLLDEEGQEIIRSDDKELKDRGNSPEFYIAKEEDYYISSADYDISENKSIINLSVPLFEGFDFKGVLVAEISGDSIWDRVRMITLGPNDSSYIFTQGGQLVVHSSVSQNNSHLDLERLALEDSLEKNVLTEKVTTAAGDMLKITMPIPGLNWQITVFRSLKDLYRNIDLVKDKILIITLFVLAIVSLATMIFARSIINPLYRLYEKSKSITVLGGKKKKLPEEEIKDKNEIELLSRQFDIMAKGLEKYHDGLEESKKVLEIKVRARTRELEEMAKQLEVAVEERTKELKKRVDELEKFRKLTVGRELKMIQLKKEIAKLKGSRSKIKDRKKTKVSGSKKSKKKKESN